MSIWTYHDSEPAPPPPPPHGGTPPHKVLGQGIAHVSAQIDDLRRLVESLRAETKPQT